MAVMNSRRLLKALFASALVLSFPLSVNAQVRSQGPAYTAKDIIERFAPIDLGSSRSVGRLGPTRGLCIGTEEECYATSTAVDQAPEIRPAPVFDLVVTFDYDSDSLTAFAKRNLDEFAKALRNEKLSRLSFLVEGHTDAKGSHIYNLDLSQRRAQSVVRYLIVQGVSAARLQAKGYGETKPRTPNPLAPDNRRVETRVSTTNTAELNN